MTHPICFTKYYEKIGKNGAIISDCLINVDKLIDECRHDILLVENNPYNEHWFELVDFLYKEMKKEKGIYMSISYGYTSKTYKR